MMAYLVVTIVVVGLVLIDGGRHDVLLHPVIDHKLGHASPLVPNMASLSASLLNYWPCKVLVGK